MCAISGIINLKGAEVDESLLLRMSDRMILRGPDESGVFIDKNIGLAHRRLSIIDIETGNQPMTIDNGNIVIVFNGEIYNFQEIREELKTHGCFFTTKSDTEVVVQAYKQYGLKKCLELLEGMYAFAIYDKNIGKVYIVRDRLGEKPLLYYKDKEYFYFASELKAFDPSLKKFTIDKMALNLFMSILYIPAPYTIYNEVHKLMPGHYIEFSKEGNLEIKPYYDVTKEKIIASDESYESAKKKLRQMVESAVKSRMVSDVPMGAFLSGGIDSSIVSAVMSKLSDTPINTFSIGFEQKEYDETERAQILAKHIGSNHTQFMLHYDDVLSILDEIITYYDEPYGGSSAIPAYYVAKLAAQKVKVVLTGDCADELFGGYDKYLADYYTRKYKKIPAFFRMSFEWIIKHIPANSSTNIFLRKAKKVINGSKHTGFELYYDFLCTGFNDEERYELIKNTEYVSIMESYKELYDRIDPSFTYLQKQQLMDIGRVLEGQMFVKVDKACMHCSLENRAPFIDSRIMKYALAMKDEFKIKGKDKKHILKEAFRDLLPDETLGFSKRGFGLPVDHWLKNELKEEMLRMCSKDFLEKQGLFNYEYIKSLIDEHLSGRENHKNKLWNLFVFQKWYLSVHNEE